ncbi:DUF445 domain-containing protein [Oxalobacteraceae bacterium A2-2]
MDKEAELKAAKRIALLFLLAAAAVFLVASVLPPNVWTGGAKAVAEAAMVGALADWFAVVALFRRVPIPIVSAHTNIIPHNKDRIADNLAVFVRDKFLDPSSLVALIRKHDPAALLTAWLGRAENHAALGGYAVRLATGVLEVADDERIRRFLHDALHAALAKVDLTSTLADIVDTLTRDGRHQQLLDAVLRQLIAFLQNEEHRAGIARGIVGWLKSEHPKKEKLLPTEWISEHAADILADALDKILRQASENPEHELRRYVDEAVQRLSQQLKTSEALRAKGERIKAYLRDEPAFNDYIGQLWGDFRAWLKADLERPDSRLQQQAAAMGRWLGRELADHPSLRASLNEHLGQMARAMAPDFAAFLTRHISDTVKNWQPDDMSRLIELNIGKDLQYIRINGTIVGGFIGLLLYCSSLLIAALTH